MQYGRYRVLALLGAGPDGTCYRAEDDCGSAVVLHDLRAARDQADLWPALVKRLRRLQLLAHPSVLRVLQISLESEPPFVVIEAGPEQSLAVACADKLPRSPGEVMLLGRQVAAALAQAHRLAVIHGNLSPATVWLRAGEPRLDFSALRTQATAADPDLQRLCQAPEVSAGVLTPAADIYALGATLRWLLGGCTASNQLGAWTNPLGHFLQDLLQEQPDERPRAEEVVGFLGNLLATPALTCGDIGASIASPKPTVEQTMVVQSEEARQQLPGLPREQPQQLGRFRLLELLGQGGMGTVYRALDLADNSQVAVKVLRPELTRSPKAFRRFQREARILAELNNPYITTLIEVNEDHGICYIALEFVAGQNLGTWLDRQGPLRERDAIALAADVARALADAHERGIVHRDVKPENILLLEQADASWRVKLSDFGLARHVVESESLQVTQAGTLIGTPLYMSPEQCLGKPVGPPTDVYALGATLFHALAGRPPFVAPTAMALVGMHCNEPPPSLQKLRPELGEGVCQIVAKCLAKAAEARYPNAGALLADLERLLRGEPTLIEVHPRLPPCDAQQILNYDFSWELQASPTQLWPHVSNTERLNRAFGLSPVRFSNRPLTEGGSQRFGQINTFGMTITWQEHPFEWVEARRMGVLREYSQGPFKWLLSEVELQPQSGGGTRLRHRIRILPNGLLGRTIAAVEVGVKARRGLERVYRRIDAALTGRLGQTGFVDPFEEPDSLTPRQRQRLEQTLDRLSGHGINPAVIERLGDFLALAPPQEVARIRPLALARRLGLDPEQVVAACLHGVREGLLVMLWDILCPVCRIPAEVQQTLRRLQEHGRCEACNLDFELDFANSVEMIFRAHPDLRASDLGTYCVGGPAHSPHVVAQVRLAAGERLELHLQLGEGAYRLRGPQLPFSRDFRVQPGATPHRWDLSLRRGPLPELPRCLRPGSQLFALTNDADRELLVRIERTALRDDALTAARASALALFRELFPGETLAPGKLVSVARVTLLVTALDQAERLYREYGDAQAFTLVHEHFRLLESRIRQESGALVKTVGDGLVATFVETTAAVRAALDLQRVLCTHEKTRQLRLRVAVHHGPAMVTTLNDHLDYFGTTVHRAMELLNLASSGHLVLSQTVAADPQVNELLGERALRGELLAESMALRYVLPRQQ